MFGDKNTFGVCHFFATFNSHASNWLKFWVTTSGPVKESQPSRHGKRVNRDCLTNHFWFVSFFGLWSSRFKGLGLAPVFGRSEERGESESVESSNEEPRLGQQSQVE